MRRTLPPACYLPLAAMGIVVVACAPAKPQLARLEDVDAVEVTVGEACVRFAADPELGELVALANGALDGWQAFWGEPEEPSAGFLFLQGDRELRRIGLGSGQLVTRLDDKPVFHGVSKSDATRWMAGVRPHLLAREPELACHVR